MTASQIVAHAVDSLTFGSPLTFQGLTALPLLVPEDRRADYLTLDEALARGSTEITETSDAGCVPELKIVNRADESVLLLDGEELIGAKQNRIVNLTILVAAQKTLVIPVSCVESGRWRHASRGFSSAPRAQFAEGRAAKMRDVTASLEGQGRREADQGAVWELIAEKSARPAASSPTQAMSAIYDKLTTPLEQFVAAFPPADRQVGAIFFVNGEVAGLDLFDAPGTWRTLAAKLVRSYAIDALDRPRGPSTRPIHADAMRFIRSIAVSAASVFPAVGEGEDVRFATREVAGAALVARGRAIHVSAFPEASI